MRSLVAVVLGLFASVIGAASCDGVTSCSLTTVPVSAGTVTMSNTTWDTTGFGAGHTTFCCTNVIIPPAATGSMMILHGGGGDDYDILQQMEETTKATTPLVVTGAVWSSMLGGETVLTVSTDPTGGAYGPTLVKGNVVATLNIKSTGGSGAGFNSGLRSPWTVLDVHGGSAPYTITVAQPAASSPGTFTGNGLALAFTLAPANVISANVGHTVIAAPQGLMPLGGADAANTAVFNMSTSGFTMTAAAPSSGVITTSQVVSSAHITDDPGVASHGTGLGWDGTYLLGKNEGTIASEAASATGCPLATQNQTWANWNSTSCVDDEARLDALAKALKAVSGFKPDCFGHSEGAGMCNREMWHPTYSADFRNFGGLSMPFSFYYSSSGGGHTTLPGTLHAWWSMAGVKDCVVVLDVADCPGANGTANAAHVTISDGSGHAGTALVAQSIDSGALTPGNWITTGAQDGTRITTCSDSTHCTVSMSQLLASSTAITTNNSYSHSVYNNSNNQSAANLAFPLPTQWINYVDSAATWANGKCAAGLGPQLPVAGFTVTAVAVGYKAVQDACPDGSVEYTELTDAGHDVPSITAALNASPAVVFKQWSDAH